MKVIRGAEQFTNGVDARGLVGKMFRATYEKMWRGLARG